MFLFCRIVFLHFGICFPTILADFLLFLFSGGAKIAACCHAHITQRVLEGAGSVVDSLIVVFPYTETYING